MRKLSRVDVEHGDLFVDKHDKILSFGITNGAVHFYISSEVDAKQSDPQRYVVLDDGDEYDEKILQHVATLIENEIISKHIFIEYIIDDKPKSVTKIFTEDGVKTLVEDAEVVEEEKPKSD